MVVAPVSLENGRLITSGPYLFVLRRIAGNWTVVKDSPVVSHVANRVVQVSEDGFYETTARRMQELSAGDNVTLPQGNNQQAWITGPWP